MKQGLIDPDCLCKQKWEGSGNDFPSVVQGRGVTRQTVWTAHTRAQNPSSKSPYPSAFSLLCFSSSILPAPTFPENPSVLTLCTAEGCHAYQGQNSPQSLDSKMLPQTLPYTDSFNSVTSHFFYFLFNPVSPFYPLPPSLSLSHLSLNQIAICSSQRFFSKSLRRVRSPLRKDLFLATELR